MKPDEIIVNNAGVTILGFPVGLAPTTRDFQLSLEDQAVRANPTANQGRELRICDSKGLSWLRDIDHESVLWLTIRLAPFRYRPRSEVDPSDSFKGKILIGQYTLQGAFSFETGEIIRKVAIPGLSIGLLPDENSIRAITVAFLQNESDAEGKSR